jgi:hypothetical protein
MEFPIAHYHYLITKLFHYPIKLVQYRAAG